VQRKFSGKVTEVGAKWREIAGIYWILILAALLCPVESFGQNPLFTPDTGSPFATGNIPVSVVVADFNGDGFADLAIAGLPPSVTVLLGNGLGGFTPAAAFTASIGVLPTDEPMSLAVGDFNNDGRPDLVVTQPLGNQVTVLINSGGSGFLPGVAFPVGSDPKFIAVADFNGDGFQDLAVSDSGGSSITILLGNGLGGFTAATGSPFAVGTSPQGVAVGDFNGDGNSDLAVANLGSNTVTVLLGNGMGGFTAATGSPFAAGASPFGIATADLNGDGHLDLAIADFGGTVTVLLGNGSGGFTADSGSPFAAGNEAESVVIADFNGDGYPDLATVNLVGSVTVLLGNGTGGFAAASGSPFAAETPESLAVGDFNGDGRPDLAIANDIDEGTVTVLLNAAPVLTANPRSLTFYASAGQPASASIPVGVSATQPGSTYIVSANQSWLQFSPSSNLTNAPTTVTLTAESAALLAGTYSGTVHFSAPNFFESTTAVTLNVATPSGTLTPDSGSPFAAGSSPIFAAIADFNRDGHQDLAITNEESNNVTVLLGNGLGGFTAASGSPFAVGVDPAFVAVGDFNGDGRPDLAVSNQADGTVSVLLGNGSGGFTTAPGSPITVGEAPVSLAVGDFNGDGHPDLAIANEESSTVTVLLGNGFGEFFAAPDSPFTVGADPRWLAIADFNGDGHPDLATANVEDNTVTVLLGNGSGGFTAATGSPFAAGSVPASLAVADLNGDGHLDLAIANEMSSNITVLLGNGSGGFTAAPGSPFVIGSRPLSLAVGDLNGDGYPDLAVTTEVGLDLSARETPRPATAPNGNLTVLLGNGLGGFTATSGTFAMGSIEFSVAIGDFNEDGRADVVLPNIPSNIRVLLGAPAATISTLSTTAAPTVAFNAALSLTLTVSDSVAAFNPPTGTVTFYDGSTPLGTASQSSSPFTFSTSALSSGPHNLTATYSGDSRSLPSNSNTLSITVTQVSQTITFNALVNQTFGAGPVTIAASATSGLPVTFTSGTPGVCSVNGASAVILSAGTCSVIASQAGNGQYGAAASVTRSFTIAPASQIIVVPTTYASSYPLAAGSFSLTVAASSGLPVTLISTTPSVCTISSGKVTLLAVGYCEIQASQAGNIDYQPAPTASLNFLIGLASQTISFTIPNHTSSDAPFELQATASSGLPVMFSVVSGPATVSGNLLTITGIGTVTVQASQPGNANYAAATATATFNVTLGLPAVTSVGNAASYAIGTVAPGSFATIFGASFAAQSANGNATSTQQLAGVTITIVDSAGNSFPVDIYYANFGQINFVVPTGVAIGPAMLTLQNAMGSTTAKFTVAPQAPGLFTADSSGKGAPAGDAIIVSGEQTQVQLAYQCSGSGAPLTCSPVPIALAPGTEVYLALFGTGIRGAGANGVAVTIGGVPATVTYAGPEGVYPALDQVNVLVPPSLAGAGAVQLLLTANGVAANPITVQFQ
jgi:uncharacterized protein (TIGR03437 family)